VVDIITIIIGTAQDDHGLGFYSITKCCTEVCPEHIKITDNALDFDEGARRRPPVRPADPDRPAFPEEQDQLTFAPDRQADPPLGSDQVRPGEGHLDPPLVGDLVPPATRSTSPRSRAPSRLLAAAA
jgi:hypothetical protein